MIGLYLGKLRLERFLGFFEFRGFGFGGFRVFWGFGLGPFTDCTGVGGLGFHSLVSLLKGICHRSDIAYVACALILFLWSEMGVS